MNEWEWQLLEDKTPLEELEIAGTKVKAGDRVRLRPRKGGDILDIALAGQIATIECLEQDYEGKQHVCVVLDDDPGRDMGLLRQPGHRFFFDPQEVEPLPHLDCLPKKMVEKTRILVAGIGNIFLGDDGFGVEVVRRLAECEFPSSVRVADFGIRGFDLAYALQDEYDVTILVDACARGGTPGTVYVIEPDLQNLDAPAGESPGFVDAHGMDPLSVLRMAKGMNAPLKRVLVVGCEPQTLGGEEGAMGLSDAVQASIGEAVRAVQSLVSRNLQALEAGS